MRSHYSPTKDGASMMLSSSKKRTRPLIISVDENLPQSTRSKLASSKVATTIDLTNDNDIVVDDDVIIASRNTKLRVKFSQSEPTVHYFDPRNGYDHIDDVDRVDNNYNDDALSTHRPASRLNNELSLLSTLHGRARRELRDISKHDFQTVMKNGTKTKTWGRKGEARWKFEFGNTVCITDETCRVEITCYKKAVSIAPAKITQDMLDNHDRATRILIDDPGLCTTHSIIIIDQSCSMSTCDVNCFRSRSDAAYGTLALDYIAEQLYQMGDEFFVDAITIIEMRDEGSILVEREPLDWILFNKVLNRMSNARPKSHGNYLESLELAERRIRRELDLLNDLDSDDIPAFMLLFLSDGKPSDCSRKDEDMRKNVIVRLAQKLKEKLTVYGMGIGAVGSDFDQLRSLADNAEENGAQGRFTHAGLNPASLSTSFSTLASSMTSTRIDLRSVVDEEQSKTEKNYTMKRKKIEHDIDVPFRRETRLVSRHVYDPNGSSNVWPRVDFFNSNCAGFDIEKDPFGKGAERLAYMFREIRPKSFGRGYEQVGGAMVAKESRFIIDEESKEAFHTSFCHVQNKSNEVAMAFNLAVEKAPLLKPTQDEVSLPPPIVFLECSVYEYTNFHHVKCGLLVEKYLHGRFTKFNSNNGFVNNDNRNVASIDLAIGPVKLTDFVLAFSHWVYERSEHRLIVCDLQGILDMEGRRPVFRLTDPAICSKAKKRCNKYGKTDLGMRGIRDFCCRHTCNSVCKALNLPTMRVR